MFKKVALVAAGLLACLLLCAATRPDSFRVERSTTIKAPPEKIFALLNDFHGWAAWSPWEKLDPGMKRTFSGAPSGVGAEYSWDGNSQVGTGHMRIVQVSPSSKLLVALDFLKPFEAHNMAEFVLSPSGDATRVSWAMYGPSPYLSKVMCIFVSMDDMIGKDFASGLANMKLAAEK